MNPMFTADKTALIVIDVQEKLLPAIEGKEKLVDNLRRLIRGMRVLEVPVVLTEQRPEALGETVPEIKELFPGETPVVKSSFSCAGEETFIRRLEKLARPQLVLAGIEAHICVCQTAMDLKSRGYEVQVVVDAVSSRTAENRELAFKKLLSSGVELAGVETILFELLRKAEGAKFKEILKIVR